jgi:RNA recognition motif-containing protein
LHCNTIFYIIAGGGSYEPLKQQPSGQYAAVSNTKDNPPCNTLFVGNLGDTVEEAELQGLFGAQPVRFLGICSL